ncbi:MAG: hypothetical protein QM749_07725 [Aquabacterium sp.]
MSHAFGILMAYIGTLRASATAPVKLESFRLKNGTSEKTLIALIVLLALNDLLLPCFHATKVGDEQNACSQPLTDGIVQES